MIQYGLLPNSVTASGSVSISESVTGNIRTITLSGGSSDVTLMFNGSTFVGWHYLIDGVYAIDNNDNAVDYSTASTSSSGSYKGVAFVVKGKAYQVAKVSTTEYNSTFWDKTNYTNIAGLTDFTTLDGSNMEGWFDEPGWLELSKDPYTWIAGALSDFNGKSNTEIIIAAQNNGTLDDTLGKEVMDFRYGSNNEGYNDWFVPSCGELAYMYLKWEEFNTLLSKIGGQEFDTWVRWSSSEYDEEYVWIVDFYNGYVSTMDKDWEYQKFRLIREL